MTPSSPTSTPPPAGGDHAGLPLAIVALAGAWRTLVRRPASARAGLGLAPVAVAGVALVLSVGLIVATTGPAMAPQPAAQTPGVEVS